MSNAVTCNVGQQTYHQSTDGKLWFEKNSSVLGCDYSARCLGAPLVRTLVSTAATMLQKLLTTCCVLLRPT